MSQDLISTLADSIIALINASPRSPRKDEIVALLRGPYEEATRTLADAQLLASYPMVSWSWAASPTSWTPVTQEQLVAAADQICAAASSCNGADHVWVYNPSLMHCTCAGCGAVGDELSDLVP